MKFFELVPKTHIDFLRPAWALSTASAVLIGAFIVLWAFWGFNLSIEFRGGTALQVKLPEAGADVGIGSVRSAMDAIGYPDATVVSFGAVADRTYLITLDISEEQAATAAAAAAPAVQERDAAAATPPAEPAPASDAAAAAEKPASDAAPAPSETAADPNAAPADAPKGVGIDLARNSLVRTVLQDLEKQLGTRVVAESIESVGPRVGSELTRSGLLALLVTSLGILLYVGVRFDSLYAPGAVIALFHDVLVTAGVFVLFQWEFDLQVLAALLVVLGYSINDTIVIYDRIRENVELRGTARFRDVVNQSLNETLSRTLLTSLTVLLVVLSLLFFGGPVLRPLSLALTIGVISGTYSTVYIASALLVFLHEYRASASVRTGGNKASSPRAQRS
jgi:preprotein translocase subunit SecF